MPVRDLSPDKKEVVNILWKCGEKKMQEVKSQKMSQKIDNKIDLMSDDVKKFKDNI